MSADSVRNLPRNVEYGIETVELLHSLHLLHDLPVVVASDDGWSWALAWAQLGVQHIRCIPFCDKASQQLEHLLAHPVLARSVRITCTAALADLPGWRDGPFLLCAHLVPPQASANDPSTIQVFWKLLALFIVNGLPDGILRLVSTPVLGHVQSELCDQLGTPYRWQELRHRRLGGLTSARLLVGWAGGLLGLTHLVAPGQRRSPPRPLDKFLEPAVRLSSWRKPGGREPCWRPTAPSAKPYPWPWMNGPDWVEAPSVFMGSRGGTIERPLTVKEFCQLADLRTDWGLTLWEHVRLWNGGCAVPLRFLVEFAIAALPWIHSELPAGTIKSPEAEAALDREGLDWGRIRAPWLGLPLGNDNSPEAMDKFAYFGWTWDAGETSDVSLATKNDDAEVNLSLWAVGGTEPHMEPAREIIRKFLFAVWVKRICREARGWLGAELTAGMASTADREAILDCVTRCANSTWWDWKDGSRLFFWRWPKAWWLEARDGALGYHLSFPQRRLHYPPIPIKEDWVVVKDREKLVKLLRRRYIVCGVCRNTVPRFPVPKGDDDIRVVWDLSKNGVNAGMYTPSFFLATMGTYLRRIEAGMYGGDFDVGEQFHNYMLHPREQVYCGVEIPEELLSELQAEGWRVAPFMRWARLVFGWQSSPYFALRMFARALELAKGAPHEPGSAFGWHRVVLNLPGSALYNPGRPRVMKQLESGLLAADLVAFFDDGRVFGPTEEHAHRAMRQVTSRLQYYGNQDAARKRREVGQRPGAWAGGVAYTDQGIVRKFVSLAKWEKAKEFLDWVNAHCLQKRDLDRAKFRSGKGFLVHMSLTYDFLQPYLKGFHLSEESWRPGRDADGWKQRDKNTGVGEGDDVLDEFDLELEAALEDLHSGVRPDLTLPNTRRKDDDAPPTVKPVPRLGFDVKALKAFLEPETPLQVIVRPVQGACYVVYGAGDASGEGFGSSLKPMGMDPLIRHGFWCTEQSEESSNWRELKNLLEAIREESSRGRLVGREVWLATDNTTAASAFTKGSSSSATLHAMVTELRLLALQGNFELHLVHIAGTRMIEIGVDGLSRGELQLGALDDATLGLVPLHLASIQRSPALRGWLDSWLGGEWNLAEPNDWFYTAQQGGSNGWPEASVTWAWDLPPAAAIHALEELGLGRLKRHGVLRGVVLIPNLLRGEWFRRFIRVIDFYFIVPAGSIPAWPACMHESLTIGIYLPLLRHQPWDWKRVPFVVPFSFALSALYKKGDPSAGPLLRQFWTSSSRVATLPKSLVSELLQSTSWSRFLHLSPS